MIHGNVKYCFAYFFLASVAVDVKFSIYSPFSVGGSAQINDGYYEENEVRYYDFVESLEANIHKSRPNMLDAVEFSRVNDHFDRRESRAQRYNFNYPIQSRV
jgi:hypothetical protein